MTAPKGNSEVCFLETLNVLLAFTFGNIEDIEGRGETKLTVLLGPVIKCFVTPPKSKMQQTTKKLFLDIGWHANLPVSWCTT